MNVNSNKPEIHHRVDGWDGAKIITIVPLKSKPEIHHRADGWEATLLGVTGVGETEKEALDDLADLLRADDGTELE